MKLKQTAPVKMMNGYKKVPTFCVRTLSKKNSKA